MPKARTRERLKSLSKRMLQPLKRQYGRIKAKLKEAGRITLFFNFAEKLEESRICCMTPTTNPTQQAEPGELASCLGLDYETSDEAKLNAIYDDSSSIIYLQTTNVGWVSLFEPQSDRTESEIAELDKAEFNDVYHDQSSSFYSQGSKKVLFSKSESEKTEFYDSEKGYYGSAYLPDASFSQEFLESTSASALSPLLPSTFAEFSGKDPYNKRRRIKRIPDWNDLRKAYKIP